MQRIRLNHFEVPCMERGGMVLTNGLHPTGIIRTALSFQELKHQVALDLLYPRRIIDPVICLSPILWGLLLHYSVVRVEFIVPFEYCSRCFLHIESNSTFSSGIFCAISICSAKRDLTAS